MAAFIAEQFVEQVGATMDDNRCVEESFRAVYHSQNFHHARDLVEIADDSFDRRQTTQRGVASAIVSLFRRDLLAHLADVIGGNMAGGKHEIAGAYAGFDFALSKLCLGESEILRFQFLFDLHWFLW